MLQNKQFITNICFVICLGFSLSQTYNIAGKVLDSETKQPLNNVNIFIEQDNIGTTTDKQGDFVLLINNQSIAEIELNIQIIGYEEKILSLTLYKNKTNVCATCNTIDIGQIFLKSKLLELESIHVHAHHNHSNLISDISLSGQKLNNNLSGNIATTLSNQPNISSNSFGIVVSKPVIRGYSGDRFLLTKDGNETGDLSQSSIDHVIALDMSEISKIEIIRGPKALIYGSNAIGGVINTEIKGNAKLKVDEFYKNLTLGGESFNKGMYGNLILYIPWQNRYQINFITNNRNSGNQTSPIKELDNTYSKTSNHKLSFTEYNKNNYVNLIFENFNMEYGIPPSLEGHISGVDIALLKHTFQFNYHQDISFYNFNQSDIKYNHIDYQHKEFENNVNNFAVSLSKKTHSLKIEFSSSHSIIGSELNYKNFMAGGFYWTPETDEIDKSIYGFHERKIRNINVLGSFRFGYLSIKPKVNNTYYSNLNIEEIQTRKFKYFSSSIGFKKIINKLEINNWIMNTMRAPRIEELYSDGPHLGSYSYEIGQPNLELEKTYGLESSIRYNSNPLHLSLTTFYNYSPYYYQMTKMGDCPEALGWDPLSGTSHPCAGEDFIEWGSGASGWLYKYQTQGVESVVKGMELNLSYHINNIEILYDFSLVRGDNLTAKRPLSYINPTKQILSIAYVKKMMNYNIRLTKIHAQNRLGEFETYTPSAFVMDFVLAYDYKNQNITLQFNNLFNEEYYNHLSKIKMIMPEPGRNITISYNLFF